MRCGTDICDVSRMREAIQKQGDKFLNRVFTPKEIQYCETYQISKYERYAARFAGKEAVYKAISPLKEQNGNFTEVEILNEENGKPYVVLHGELSSMIRGDSIEISLSHEKEYAIAMCVIADERK
mgnify:CR=1 FL=1